MGKLTPQDLAATGPNGSTAPKIQRKAQDRDSLLEQFKKTRALTLTLSDPLSTEDMVIQTMDDVSPTKWHMAHTTWFFETFLLKPQQTGYEPFHDAFEYLFNSYYNAVGSQFPRPERGLLSRPTVKEIIDYRRHVDDAMDRLIAHVSEAVWADIAPLIELGVHHEQQHQELLLTDIKHVLSWNPLEPVGYGSKPKILKSAPPLAFIDFDGGLFHIGHDGEGFAFDCEGPRHQVLVRPHSLANRPVTNGEYLAFIEDGGYTTPHLWLSDGWADLQSGAWTAPIYWRQRDGVWTEFSLHGPQKLDLHAPVSHINFYEASAYAAWANARLPHESELELAAAASTPDGSTLDTDHIHPKPSDRADKNGLYQLFGDVWEWTQSAYSPYPGFSPAAGAVGEYNGKFMSGQQVLKGGSCATPDDHMRATYRNFFPPAARWQFTGLRLAKDL